jgi:hypothetical protein
MATSTSRGNDSGESKINLLRTLQNIPASFLKEITDDLSDDRKLGTGAFGTVYKVRFSTLFGGFTNAVPKHSGSFV